MRIWFPLLFAALTGRSGRGLAQPHEILINCCPSARPQGEASRVASRVSGRAESAGARMQGCLQAGRVKGCCACEP